MDGVPDLPPFVAHVGNTPASFVQASYLIAGRVLTFQVPLPSLDEENVHAAVAKLSQEVAACPRS